MARFYLDTDVWKLFNKGFCLGVRITLEEEFSAQNLNQNMGLGFRDCLHVITAKRIDAIAVSFDRHWKRIGEVLGKRIFEPEEAILLFKE